LRLPPPSQPDSGPPALPICAKDSVRHHAVVGPHVPVWSFHIHAYCMLPDCDFDVFRYVAMTGENERAFFGSPEEARTALQKAGLNYFLFSNELDIGDPVVVVSPLFAPDNIAKYLGLRWTDGTTTLLTWLGPDTSPLSQEWLATYCRAVAGSLKGPLAGGDAIRKILSDLHARPRPWRSLELPVLPRSSWIMPQIKCPSPRLQILGATYGQSCHSFIPPPPARKWIHEGNVTNHVQKACNAQDKNCTFLVDNATWGDPAQGCLKDFSVSYRCNPGEPPRRVTVTAEAAGKTVQLKCDVPPPLD
jgi:hypothetical protein